MDEITNPKEQIPMKSQSPTPASKPYDLRKRTLEFAIRILEISGRLPATREAIAVRSQFSRAGSSVGANVEEADGAISRAEKRRCFIIARKECRETRYWLNLIEERWGGKDGFKADIREATGILCILSTIIDKLS